MKGVAKVVCSFLVLTFLVSTLAVPAFSQGSEPGIPPVTVNGNFVLDQLNWLTTSQEEEINAIVTRLDSLQLAQIAVVTQHDCGDDSVSYRNQFFRTWGIGHKDKNNGLLLLVCWYGGDRDRRTVEQEVGYGLEGILPDLLTRMVFEQHFVPAFTSDKAGDGLVEMVKAYDKIIRGESNAVTNQRQVTSADFFLSGAWLRLVCLSWPVFFFIIILFFALVLVSGKNKSGSSYSSSTRSSRSSSSDDSSSSSNSSSSSSFGGGSSGGGGSSSKF